MTSRHLVTHADLTFLCHVDLGELHDSRGQIIAYRDVILLAAVCSLDLLALAQIVDYCGADKVVLMGIGSPLRQIDGIVVDLLECSSRKLGTLGYDVAAEEVLDTLRGLSVGECHEFLD